VIPSDLVRDAGVRFGLAHVVLVAVLLVAGACRLGLVGTEVLAAGSVGLYGAGLTLWLRAVLGGITWAFVTGFFVHRYGDLTFGRSDLLRCTLVVGLVVLAAELRRGPAAPRERADWAS
jgi:hypothetical protein